MAEKTYGIQPVTDETLKLAEDLIRAGEVVVIPTDTVYGVVADPTNPAAVEKIFQVKHRPHAKTVQILAARMEDTRVYGVRVPSELKSVEDTFMPGAVSVIARVNAPEENSGAPRLATVRTEADGSLTQAVRLPDNPVSLRILSALGPIAASSANLSGQDSPASAQDAYAQLGDTVPLYLDGGPTPGPVASTVVAWDEKEQQPVFLREGVVPAAEIRAVLAGEAQREARA